jgi:methyltransferase
MDAAMPTQHLFTYLILLVMAERVLELALSLRNGRRALAMGGVVAPADPYAWMVAVHSLFLAACLAEVWLLRPPFRPVLAAAMLAVVAVAMALRYWAIATLGERWNTRVICLPETPAVTGGPYRFVRHPNYVAVTLEVAALPLVHSAWITAVVFSAASFFLLRNRIRVEEAALRTHADYDRVLGGQPRFLPRRR